MHGVWLGKSLDGRLLGSVRGTDDYRRHGVFLHPFAAPSGWKDGATAA
jgi:hypothetical protein